MTEYDTHTKEQRIMTLYVADDAMDRTSIKADVANYMNDHEGAPSGATFQTYAGLWRDTFEPGMKVEVWVDDEEEARHVRNIRDQLQDDMGLYCICLKDRTVTMEHRQPAGGGDE